MEDTSTQKLSCTQGAEVLGRLLWTQLYAASHHWSQRHSDLSQSQLQQAGKEDEHRAGLEWLGSALPSEVWEAICLPYQLSSPTHLSVAIRHDLFMLPHWQLPDTVSQTSLEANYHTNCQRQKTLPDCCPTSTPAYKSFLNKTAQNKQSTTLMQLQLSRETICPRFRVITRGPWSIPTN